ncbi:hypothetical protein D3C87_1790930 [compost metagenome]
MHRFHEGDVGIDRFLMRRDRIRHQGRRADACLDRVEQGQAREHTDRQLLLFRPQCGPGGNVVGERHLFRQPEIAGEAVPDFEVLVVLDTVPVDGAYGLRALGRLGLHLDVHRVPRGIKERRRRSPALPCRTGPSDEGGCSRSS